MVKLDELIVDNIKQILPTPRRLTDILRTLIERQADKDRAVQGRRAALNAELASKEEKLKRLYRALEDGIVEPDVHLKDRIQNPQDRAGHCTSLPRPDRDPDP
jgi:site-specific DNA recombinase